MERGPEGREGQVGREGPAGREGLPGEAGVAGGTGKTGARGETGAALPWSVRAAFIAVVVVSGIAVTAVGYFLHENNQRVNEIQAARVASCQRTYEGIREVFTPFFPNPATATPDQMARLVKFNTTIDDLKRNCTRQTRVSKKEANG